MSTSNTHGWRITARDPLVFGDGTRQPALMASQRAWLPPQGTLAGFVRARFWDPNHGAPSEQSTALLRDVSFRGPWLYGPSLCDPSETLWLPAPLDARCHHTDNGWALGSWAKPADVRPGEGVYISGAGGPRPSVRPVELQEKLGSSKLQAPSFPLWRLDHVVRWNLGQTIPAARIPELDPSAPRPLERERRVHVGLHDEHGTAIPEELFTTAGTRLAEGYDIALDVTSKSGKTARGGLGNLGGRSRPSLVQVDGTVTWPSFSSVEPIYEEHLAKAAPWQRAFLRFQLVTPGCFAGWHPNKAQLPGDLELVAALIPAPSVESGWDMVRRQPRAVRRLVSPGSIYWYEVADPSKKRLLELCKQFWSEPLPSFDPTTPRDTTRADPDHDGYGQVIPGLYLESR